MLQKKETEKLKKDRVVGKSPTPVSASTRWDRTSAASSYAAVVRQGGAASLAVVAIEFERSTIAPGLRGGTDTMPLAILSLAQSDQTTVRFLA